MYDYKMYLLRIIIIMLMQVFVTVGNNILLQNTIAAEGVRMLVI